MSTLRISSKQARNRLVPISQPFRSVTELKKSDEVLDQETRRWFQDCLPCIAGRREFNLKRYQISVADRSTVKDIFERFISDLHQHRSIACLFVFNNEKFYDRRCDPHTAFMFLAEQMQPVTKMSAHSLVNGSALTTTITLKCPVTGVVCDFDDFECIAFCPQSSDPEDQLYDPLMYAPYPSVNLSSDVFAFSMFVHDMASSLLKTDIASAAANDIELLSLFFDECVARWHRIASRTIRNFQAITDTSKCPIHLTDEGNHWLAAHQDPAFAESIKLAHLHELPNVYARRIVSRWLSHFQGVEPYNSNGLAYPGFAPQALNPSGER